MRQASRELVSRVMHAYGADTIRACVQKIYLSLSIEFLMWRHGQRIALVNYKALNHAVSRTARTHAHPGGSSCRIDLPISLTLVHSAFTFSVVLVTAAAFKTLSFRIPHFS